MSGLSVTAEGMTGPLPALGDGAHVLVARVENLWGVPGVKTVAFVTDAAAPVLSVTNPVADGPVATGTLQVTGTLTDTGSGAHGVSVNGQGLTLAGGAFTGTVTLQEGSNTLVFTGTDVAGNTATVTRTLTYTPPDCWYRKIHPGGKTDPRT